MITITMKIHGRTKLNHNYYNEKDFIECYFHEYQENRFEDIDSWLVNLEDLLEEADEDEDDDLYAYYDALIQELETAKANGAGFVIYNGCDSSRIAFLNGPTVAEAVRSIAGNRDAYNVLDIDSFSIEEVEE